MNEQLSITHQAEETNVDDCFMETCAFGHLREFEQIQIKPFYDSVVVKVLKILRNPPALPHQRQLPRRLY